MQTLDVISVNLWQILVSLLNLVLIFFIVKKLFYLRVKSMLDKRQSTIDGDYAAAKEAKDAAESDLIAYREKLDGANEEADRLIKNAVDIASAREREILADAKVKADGIIRRAENDAILERKKAEDGIKKEIVEVSSLLTEKMLEREITADDHKKLIDSFIESIGDGDGADK